MKSLLFLLSYVIICVYANHSAQHERCEILQSVADTDNSGNVVQCSVGQSCFSLDCTPTLIPNSEFHILIEPCKTPAAILVNTTISGQHYSHEFTHSETIDLPTNVPAIGTAKLVVNLDNSDNTTLVFSVQLVAPGIGNYTIVPETSFPLDNLTCIDGHVVTSPPPPHQHTTTAHITYSCMETCVAIHKMVAKTNSLCQSTDNCLTINCQSPSSVGAIDITSSYTIEPCKTPPTILARFDDDKNNIHISKNITKDTTIPLPLSLPLSPEIEVTLEDPDDFTILFGVNLVALGQTFQLLPQQRIPIDKSGCPGYTGPTVNPYCTTQQTTASSTATAAQHTSTHPGTHTHAVHTTSTPKHNGNNNNNNTLTVGINPQLTAGISVGVIVLVIVVAAISVIVTLSIVYLMMKRKSKGVYTYSHFQAMEEEYD